MNSKDEHANSIFNSSKFLAAPLELKCYAFFSAVITIFSVLLIFLPKINRAIVPITGWLPALGYMFGIYFIYALIFLKSMKANRIKFRTTLISFLIMHILFGLFNLLSYNGNNFSNPYLTISKWQPVWTILIPLFWIVLLLSSRVTRFCKLTEG